MVVVVVVVLVVVVAGGVERLTHTRNYNDHHRTPRRSVSGSWRRTAWRASRVDARGHTCTCTCMHARTQARARTNAQHTRTHTTHNFRVHVDENGEPRKFSQEDRRRLGELCRQYAASVVRDSVDSLMCRNTNNLP